MTGEAHHLQAISVTIRATTHPAVKKQRLLVVIEQTLFIGKVFNEWLPSGNTSYTLARSYDSWNPDTTAELLIKPHVFPFVPEMDDQPISL